MIEWFILICVAVLPMVVGRCIYEMGGDHERN
jgi:hypothetical protein